MIHYFCYRNEQTGDFYSICFDGGTKKQCEDYLHEISTDVRFVRSLDGKRFYKRFKDIGFAKIFYSRFIGPYAPPGAMPDTRKKVIED